MAPPRTLHDRPCDECGRIFRPSQAEVRHCSNSCGHRTHGQTNSRTHRAWKAMRQRCLNPRTKCFARYGGRGIAICERWASFNNFVADMGECASGMSLDRYPDNNGDYEPLNCRWATRNQQQQNKRTSRLVTWNGETLALGEWAKRYGVKRQTLEYRLSCGRWSLVDALTSPGRTTQQPKPAAKPRKVKAAATQE